MKSADEIKKLAEKIRFKSSTATRDRILADAEAALMKSRKDRPDVFQPGLSIWRTIMKSRIAKLAAAAVVVLGVYFGLKFLGGPIDGASFAWAEVMQDFEQHLRTNDYIHLVITNRKPILRDNLNLGDVIKKEEIWVQRPFNMRIEEVYRVNNAPDYITFTPSTAVYNEEGEFYLNHNRKIWGFRDADLINVKHKITYRQLRNKYINNYLAAKYYAKYDWQEDTYNRPNGKAVDYTKLDGEGVTIYEFSEYEGKRHKCWLRDTDGRLLRMEVYEEQEKRPTEIYEVLSYEAPLNKHFFDASIPEDYTNGQLLGYEDQPQLINPQVATVVTDEQSAKFYRLNIKSGQTREEAIVKAIATTEPAIEVKVEQPSNLKVILKQPQESNNQKPYKWNSIGFGVVGGRKYGVLIDKGHNSEKKRIVIKQASEYKGEGQIIFEFLNYRTDYSYCKVAFDADGDGQMDVWCQVPSEEVASTWRRALTKD